MTREWVEMGTAVQTLAHEWREARPERQARPHLEPEDFARLGALGFREVAGGLAYDSLFLSSF